MLREIFCRKFSLLCTCLLTFVYEWKFIILDLILYNYNMTKKKTGKRQPEVKLDISDTLFDYGHRNKYFLFNFMLHIMRF